MRLVAVLLVLLVAGGTVGVTFALVQAVTRRRARRAVGAARWQVLHAGRDGLTVVTVGLVPPGGGAVWDEHVVARIVDDDPAWSERFVAARQEAEERAFHLNGDGRGLPSA